MRVCGEADPVKCYVFPFIMNPKIGHYVIS